VRPLAVALAALALLDTLFALSSPRRVVAAAVALLAAAFALAGGLAVGCSLPGSTLLAATIAVEAPVWVAARRCWRPPVVLVVIGVALLARVATTGMWDVRPHAPLDRWLTVAPAAIARVDADRVAYVIGATLFVVAAGNTLVRLLLSSVGSLPATEKTGLRGGRVIGSIERALIFGLGVSGDVTTAGLVIAAKGILRFGEMQKTGEENIDPITEYVLVGSMASYALALAFVPLARA
jgi:hypothetical protein